MQSAENRIIVACAGSGKTTFLVKEALSNASRRVAILTYTNNNERQIINKFGLMNGGVPKHVDVMTWFGFLLRECVRPYQRFVYEYNRIESICFVTKRSAPGTSKTNVKKYYLANGDLIYSDKISEFAVKCETVSAQCVTNRLQGIYTDIFIDEFQDLAGWDLEFIEQILKSNIRVTLVGDPRQHTYSTNVSPKNSQYAGHGIDAKLAQWKRDSLCQVLYKNRTYRCNLMICKFANGLWPDMDDMEHTHNVVTGHDGVFLVPEKFVPAYINSFRPQILRHQKTAKSYGCNAINFGASKGMEFERVLIVPTEPIKKYLRNGAFEESFREKLYVAVTRAKYSVGFVFDGPSSLVSASWTGV